jgi:3',5'-nucleoside bisphosphate phosphatase
VNADLHCHSTVSDGLLSPAQLVCRAKANGVTLLALTDHDELAGLAQASQTAKQEGVGFVPGVEVSVTFCDETIHVVGLGIDPCNPTLEAGLQKVREGRDARARQIGHALARAGLPGVYEGACALAKNPSMVSRSHFARCLVQRGVARDVASVFQHYMVPGRPGFIRHEWALLEEALAWIHAAGGLAVLAHPARYRLGQGQMKRLLQGFVAQGGEGIEVVSSAHSSAEMAHFAGVARTHGLLASRGSDFHGPDESRLDLGQIPPLPAGLEPIWSRLGAFALPCV